MTIRVTVTNADASAAHDIQVEQYDQPTANGHLAAGEATLATPAVSVAPGESKDFYVHSSRFLKVTEVA